MYQECINLTNRYWDMVLDGQRGGMGRRTDAPTTPKLYSQIWVKHHLNCFLKNKGSFPVINIFLLDKVETIYSKYRFDNHKGKQPGMVNAHLPLKCPYSLAHYYIFKTLRHIKVLASYRYNIKDKFCLKKSDSYQSYRCKKNGMLYSDNAKIMNTRLTISMVLYNWHETLSSTESVWH